MKFWHKIFNSYFGFNKQQRNGLLVLVIIVLLLFAIRLSIPYFIKPDPILIADFSKVSLASKDGVQNVTSDSVTEKTPFSLFNFDPNTATKEELLKLGFKEKLANTLINYRNKGAHFFKKEDLKKVYGMREEFYNILEPYISIGKTEGTKKKEEIKETGTSESAKGWSPTGGKPGTRNKIELNTADSLTLLKLKGIGPVFAKKILKFRNSLGGFYSVDQLAEVYGLKDSVFQALKNEVSVNSSLIKKININNEVFKELIHPYLPYEKVRAVFYWRKKNGAIQNIDQVKLIMSDNAMFEKVKPYIDFK